MATVTNSRSNLQTDPIRDFRFLVQFLPHDETAQKFGFKPTLGFMSVSGLSAQVESIAYREGGYNTTVHQIPGQTSFSPISMSRGLMLGTPQHWNWLKRLFHVAGTTGTQGNFRADMNVYVLAHPVTNTASTEIGNSPSSGLVIDDLVHAKFKVYNVWPSAVAYSDLNAGSNGYMVEQMTLVHEGFNMALASTWGGSVRYTSL